MLRRAAAELFDLKAPTEASEINVRNALGISTATWFFLTNGQGNAFGGSVKISADSEARHFDASAHFNDCLHTELNVRRAFLPWLRYQARAEVIPDEFRRVSISPQMLTEIVPSSPRIG